MSDAKFTPGPWQNRPINICRQYDAGLDIQFLVTSDKKREEEGMANAYLISASPEMYSALNRCVHYLKCAGHDRITADEIIAEAEAALKKARGEQ